MVARGEKKLQWLRASFLGMRALTGWVHSKRLAESKNEHCLQLCNSAPQRGHLAVKSIPGGSRVAQEAQRTTSRLPGRLGVFGPKLSDFFAGGRSVRSGRSRPPPESMYPRCLYFLSILTPFSWTVC